MNIINCIDDCMNSVRIEYPLVYGYIQGMEKQIRSLEDELDSKCQEIEKLYNQEYTKRLERDLIDMSKKLYDREIYIVRFKDYIKEFNDKIIKLE